MKHARCFSGWPAFSCSASLPSRITLWVRPTRRDKEVKLEGKIVQLLLRNPHSFLQIDVPDKDGTMQRWSLEWRSSGQLGQAGIKRDTLKAGDEVVVTVNPSRTKGDNRGALKTLHRTSDGFGWGTRPGETID